MSAPEPLPPMSARTSPALHLPPALLTMASSFAPPATLSTCCRLFPNSPYLPLPVARPASSESRSLSVDRFDTGTPMVRLSITTSYGFGGGRERRPSVVNVVVVADKAVNVLEAEACRPFFTRLASSSSSSNGLVVRVGDED